MNFRTEETYNRIQIQLNFDSNINKFKGDIVVSNNLVYQRLIDFNLIIIDESGNSNYIYDGEISNLSVDISDENNSIDLEPPTFIEATFNKNEVKVGEKLILRVKAKDDASGIDYIKVSYNDGEVNGYPIKDIYLEFDGQRDEYVAEIDIKDYMLYKKIVVTDIEICDNSMKKVYISNDEIRNLCANVIDVEWIVDAIPLIFKGIYIDKNTAKVGDNVRIAVDAIDDLSGVEIVRLSYAVGVKNYSSTVNMNYNVEKNQFEYLLYIPEYFLYNSVRITELEIIDRWGNSAYVKKEGLGDSIINLPGEGNIIDEVKTTFNSINFSSEIINVNDTPKNICGC